MDAGRTLNDLTHLGPRWRPNSYDPSARLKN
jgi:hypothetical protein